jgi:threonine/homoserine/homoserine lactone efflux protein
MLTLLLKVLALGVASAMSPGILAISLGLAFGKEQSSKKITAFFLGGAVALALVILGAWALDEGMKYFNLSSQQDLLFGGILIAFGLFSLSSWNRKPSGSRVGKGSGSLKWFLIGLIGNITNLDAVALEFTSAKQVFASDVSPIPFFILLGLGGFFYLSPILIPMFYSRAKGSKPALLQKAGVAMDKYGNVVIGILFLLFGAYFIWQGLA